MKYVSKESFEIKGRGTVFIVENEKDRLDFDDLVGEKVVIDGKKFKCLGVEAYATARPVRAGVRIGILVGLLLLTLLPSTG